MNKNINLNTVLKKMKKFGLNQLSVQEMEILEKHYRENAEKKNKIKLKTNKKTTKKGNVTKVETKIVDKDIFDIFSQLFEILPKKYHSLISNNKDTLEDEMENYNENLLFGVEETDFGKYNDFLLEDMFSELELNPSNLKLRQATVAKCAGERELLFLVKLLKAHEQNSLFKKILLKAIARKLKLIENSKKKLSIKETLDKFNSIEISHLLHSIHETGGKMFKISQLERVFHAIGDKEIKVKDIGLPHISYMFKRYLFKASKSDAKTIFNVVKKLDKKTLVTILKACTKDKKFVSSLKLNQMTVISMIQNYLE